MSTLDDNDEIAPGWVSRALDRDYALNARADIAGDASDVPDRHGGIRLSPVGHQLLAWWFEARGDAAMPSADDVSPRALRQLLPYIRYMSWDGDELVIRIFGSALAAAAGRDLTGSRLYEGDYEGRAADVARMKALHDTPCGLVMIRELPDGSGGIHPCELLTLPVAAGSDGSPRVIGTVMGVELKEASWSKKVGYSGDIALRRAAFIDIGYGLPKNASRLLA
ncbi:PAS domain-containing protein [Parvibaculum sp.]|jgi:hypothetical protein|uniref:PAS domain-containing protein n=1 Tax=Parvibaculum sp. TaxID=2024848 RepID=UPI001B221477|nr:PAS domain-containing protein [Parvibaculum sp.]MBO6634193.1 PAS domain-containing protein [Parvibaculum sp.]MBO6677460.1 PAS domain-containing protein [Parvibaculum sp.]MBO6685083.1 PAS domain-containing protein [Parvibaculum sp.]MBO6905776.1 PAS domain-containing protein [Parvibaculum sp.]